MLWFIFFVAILNLAAGFGIAAYLGNGHAAPETSDDWSNDDLGLDEFGSSSPATEEPASMEDFAQSLGISETPTAPEPEANDPEPAEPEEEMPGEPCEVADDLDAAVSAMLGDSLFSEEG